MLRWKGDAGMACSCMQVIGQNSMWSLPLCLVVVVGVAVAAAAVVLVVVAVVVSIFRSIAFNTKSMNLLRFWLFFFFFTNLFC